MTRVLLTGGTGFVGAALIERILATTGWEVLSLERLPSRLNLSSYGPRVRRIYHDFCVPLPARLLVQLGGVRYVVHAGAEVSGMRSLANPARTVQAGVMGTYHLLEAARALKPERFVFISTGEVVGAVPLGEAQDEDAALRPSNPYSAAKAAAEALVRSYRRSFGVPAVTVRSMNLFGPRQGVERFVPLVVKALLAGEVVTCHVGPDGRPGSRNWLHVDPFIEHLLGLVDGGLVTVAGGVYHLVGPERDNLQIIRALAGALGCDSKVKDVVAGPSHDLRYALKDTRLSLSFDDGFEESLADTARWYQRNPEHLQ